MPLTAATTDARRELDKALDGKWLSGLWNVSNEERTGEPYHVFRGSRNQMGKSLNHEAHEGHEGFGKLLLRTSCSSCPSW